MSGKIMYPNDGLDIDPEVKSRTDDFFTAVCIKNGRALFDLVKAGICFEVEYAQGSIDNRHPALYWAGNNYAYDAVKELIRQGADVSCLNWSPLHFAVMDGDVEKIDGFVKQGMDINAEGSDGSTPLNIAVLHRNPAVLGKMISCGADINHINLNGDAALHLAVIGPVTEGDKRLIRMRAARTLIENGADINISREEGNTPLACAIYRVCPYMVKFLGAYGAEYNCYEDEENSYFALMVNSGRDEVVMALMECGADVNFQNPEPMLCLAIKRGNKLMADLLVDAGANIYAHGLESEPAYYNLLADYNFTKLRFSYQEFYWMKEPPKSVKEVYHLMAAMPREDCLVPVDRVQDIRKIFLHAKWENLEQAEKLLTEFVQHKYSGVRRKIDVRELMQKIEVVRSWVSYAEGDKSMGQRGV